MNWNFLACISRWLSLAVLSTLLAACAGTQAYREGNDLVAQGKFEPGLAKLQEAVSLEPRNVEFRITLVNQRLSILNSLNMRAEAVRRQGNLTEVEKIYQQMLAIDPNNIAAKQGLNALAVERRHKQIIDEAEALFKKDGANNLTDALEKLRPVLAENPNQREALNLKARINERQAKQKPVEAQLSAAYRKPITLEFKDASLRAVFDVIARVSGLNFFFDKDVRPDLKATVFTKDTSIDDVIRLLLVTNQLEQTILNGNSILIYPNTPQKLKEYQQLSVRTFYLANADVKAVSNTIKTILKAKDMVIDERLGLIIMRDTPEVIRMAERIISLQDLGDPEVMLEVEVMEIKRSRLMELGVRWPDTLGLSLTQLTTSSTEGATSTGASPLTLEALRNISDGKINAAIGGVTINAKKENSDSNILANPRIRVRNKEKAKILIGDRVPVITTTSTSTGFVSDSVTYVDVGLKLEVEPNIYLDEEVAIKINLEVSNLVREVISKSGTLSYQIGTRNASTALRLKDGETQVLAGLISDEDRSTANRVPGFGDLPVLSRIFGSQKDDTQRSEIVLSITPRVVRSIRRPDLIAAEFDAGTEANTSDRGLMLRTAEEIRSTEVKDSAVQKANSVPQPVKLAPGNNAPASEPQGTAQGAGIVPAANGTGNEAAGPGGAPLGFSWQGPAEVKVGDQFSVALRVDSQGAMRGLPVLIGYNPSVLQVSSVQEGDFFKQANGQTSFSQRIDPAQGKIFIAAVRQNASGGDNGINGRGSIALVSFKAIKSSPENKIQLLTATPEPLPSNPLTMPVDFSLKIK